MTVLNTTDKNFKNDVLASAKPVLVDFWAEWCGPCKAIAPALDEISNEMSETIIAA
jgi:thioredoxin 1